MGYRRLETSHLAEDSTRAMRCDVADPMWMLARQFQVGELHGDDGGRAVLVSADVRRLRPDRLRGGSPRAPRGPSQDLGDDPLEPRVEAEAVVGSPAEVAVAARWGARLLRRLRADPSLDPDEVADLRDACRFRDRAIDDERLTAADRLRLERGVDARRVLAAHADGAWKGGLADVVALWAEDAVQVLGKQATAAALRTWDPERQEHSFHVGWRASGSVEDDEPLDLALDFAEYHGGRADWFGADLLARDAVFEVRKGDPDETIDVVASPVRFTGMPALRWWEVEDHDVAVAYAENSETDIARALVAGFVTTFGSDWLMIPVPAETGQLVAIERVEVIDSFGEPTTIEPMGVRDHRRLEERTGERPWRFFELSGDRSPAAGFSPWLYLAPTVTSVDNSRPVERVLLSADEVSNVGWAVEEVVETSMGRPWERAPHEVRPSPVPPADGVMRYEMEPAVPEHWLPLLPVRREGSARRWLQRGRLHPPAGAPEGWGLARGTLLEPGSRLLLHEEEVPRTGAEVTRRRRLTRTRSGRPLGWTARRKRLSDVTTTGSYVPDRVHLPPPD